MLGRACENRDRLLNDGAASDRGSKLVLRSTIPLSIQRQNIHQFGATRNNYPRAFVFVAAEAGEARQKAAPGEPAAPRGAAILAAGLRVNLLDESQ